MNNISICEGLLTSYLTRFESRAVRGNDSLITPNYDPSRRSVSFFNVCSLDRLLVMIVVNDMLYNACSYAVIFKLNTCYSVNYYFYVN